MKCGALFLAALSIAHAAELPAQRKAWTTSRVSGSPEPPAPFVAEAIFPKLKWEKALDLVLGPDGRFYVLQRAGKIFAFDPREAEPQMTLFADVKALHPNLDSIYGMIFHPRFPEKREVFICYTTASRAKDGEHVASFKVPVGEPLRLDGASEQVVITFGCGSHSGGCLRFGRDGFLYISTGDTSPTTPPDEDNTGQDISDLEASILRIDVDQTDGGRAYRIPADNPFLTTPGARGEVWAYGLRNPWKMAFHPTRDELWVGDVGWEMWEMLRCVKSGTNHGWSLVEGPQPVKPDGLRGPTPIITPVVAHSHSEAASITGGVWYRGAVFPELAGSYIYGDYMTGRMWALWHDGERIVKHLEIARTPLRPVTIAEDAAGEIVFLTWADADAGMFRLARNPDASRTNTAFPRQLSETGLFADAAAQTPAAGVLPYRIAAPLWEEGATAERWIALPQKTMIGAAAEKDARRPPLRFNYPFGSVFARTVSWENRRIETQLLHWNGREWNGYSYRWNDAQTDAELVPAAGATAQFGAREYRFAARAECARCHNDESRIIGFHPGQLRDGDQLARFIALGVLDEKARAYAAQFPFAALDDPHAALETRARSFLHVNCAHCHRFLGGGSTEVWLNMETPLAQTKLIDAKPMQGSLGLDDARVIAAGDPWRSALLYRHAKLGSGHMPAMGSREPDDAALRVLHDWIAALTGELSAASRAIDAQLAAAKTGDAAAAQAMLAQPTSALALSLAIGRGEMGKSIAASAVTQPLTGDLFERFLPPEQRRKTLGPAPDPAALLALAGDAAHGKIIFTTAACMACHRVSDTGIAFGPDLSAIGANYDRAALLDHILHPNKTVAEEWKLTTLKLRSGETVSGFIAERTAERVRVRQAGGIVKDLAPADIKAEQLANVSAMPEGLLANLTAQEAANLLAFLASQKATPQPGAQLRFERHAFPLPQGIWSVAAVDWNGDGQLDLTAMGETTVYALLAPDWRQVTLAEFSGGKLLYCVPWDANGDGRADLAVGRFNVPPSQFALGWIENTGRAEAAPFHELDREISGIHGLATGDLDGDGTPDLVADSNFGPPLADSLAWFRMKTFERHVITRGGAVGRAHYLDVADLNGDRRRDVLLGASAGGTFSWWENPADQTAEFTRHEIAAEPGATNLKAADVNHDGIPDVIASNGHGQGLAWFEGSAWTKHVIEAELKDVHALDTADLDGDGDVDFACASYTQHVVAWFENDGHGHFTRHDIDTANAQESYDLKIADLDADGLPDLLLAGRKSNNAVWYRNLRK